jgi:hypothetical protein
MKNKNQIGELDIIKIFFKIKNLFTLIIGILIFFLFIFFLYQFKDVSLASDDFCQAWLVLKKGLINSIIDSYNGWSGRFSYYLSIGLVFLIPKTFQFIVLLSCFLFNFEILKKIFNLIFDQKEIDKNRINFIFLSIFFLFFVLDERFYSLIFNPVLNLTYFFPLTFIFLIIYLLLINLKNNFFNLFIYFLLGFLISGFQENLMFFLFFSFLVIILFVFTYRIKLMNKDLKIKLLSLFIGIFIGGIVMYLAPGNRIRGGHFMPLSFFESIDRSLNLVANDLLSLSFFYSLITRSLPIYLFFVLFNLRSAFKKNFLNQINLEIILLVLFIFNIFFKILSNFQGFYVVGFLLGGRQLSYLFYFEIFFSIFFALFFYKLTLNFIEKKSLLFNYLSLIFIFCLIFIKSYDFFKFVNQLNFYSTYEKKIFEIKEKKLKLSIINLPNHPFQLEQISDKKDNWSYQCLKNFLDVKDLKVVKIN